MMLERAVSRLDVRYVSKDTALEMGQLGCLQWLGALKDDAGYPHETARAFEVARPFTQNAPAVAIFCHILLNQVPHFVRRSATNLIVPRVAVARKRAAKRSIP
ncbi:MAG: hypothetical protein AAF665_12245 [Pseudomonadota bacterium]